MKIQMLVRWYDRNRDLTPNYDAEHHGSFFGETPAEIMAQLNAFKDRHDLNEYTQIEIVGIY